MDIKHNFQELFANQAAMQSLPVFALNLVIAAVLGLVLGAVYVRFGSSLSNRRSFAGNFLLLTVTTTLIISIVKSSLALSLGLVGALSIVRFRAAIKEPEELAFLFLAISVGLGLGAGQALITVVALAIILLMVVLRSLVRKRPPQSNLFVTVSTREQGKLTANQILETLVAAGAQASLKRYDESPDSLRASFLVDFKDIHKMEDFGRRLREICQGVEISCLDDQGLNA